MREFRVPPLVVTGAGASAALGGLLKQRGYRRVFVISDPGVVGSPAVPAVLSSLRSDGLTVTVHDCVSGEPTVGMVERALADLRASDADVVVGLGGGSPMDTAKAVAVLASAAPGAVLPDFEGADKAPRRTVPLVCVPTTAGTGSEVTRFTIITDEARDRKMLISSWEVLPDVALVDPTLSHSLPGRYTVSTGVDALTHAVEAYVSRRAQPLSDTLALSAIRRIGRSLQVVYRSPDDAEARHEMALAALEAGMAFCNASVALVHGMARPLGAHFGVPHGLANAALLAEVSAFSAPAASERYVQIADALGSSEGSNAVERTFSANGAIGRLCRDLDVPPLRDLGVERDRFERVVMQMAQDALASGSPANNPRVATAEEIVALYRACW